MTTSTPEICIALNRSSWRDLRPFGMLTGGVARPALVLIILHREMDAARYTQVFAMGHDSE